MDDFNEIEVPAKEVEVASDRVNSLTFDDKVIKKIVGFATSEIPGIIAISGNLLTGITDILRSSDDPTKGISVEVGKERVTIDMKVVCEYGLNIPDIFQNVIDKVSGVVKKMTGLEVGEVNIHVYDVLTKEDFEKQNRKKPEEKPEPKPEIPEKSVEDPEFIEEEFDDSVFADKPE